ncbi:ABC transporter permease [soil metagenome]
MSSPSGSAALASSNAGVGDEPRARRRAAPKVTALVLVLIVELVTFSIMAPAFLTRANFLNVLTAIAVTGIVAMPGTFLIVAGQFDLSVASITALTGVAMGTVAESHSLMVGVVAALVVGTLAGLTNGFLVTVIGVNALITTLGMLSVLSGLARVVADGLSIGVEGFATLGTARPLGVPLPVVVFLGIVALFTVVGRFTVFGRTVYAIGSNPSAARLAGIKTRRTIMMLFVFSGLACALAGLILTSMLGSASPTAAVGLELSVVTAIVLGGTTLSGGEGSALGTLVGLLIVGFLNNGLIIKGVDPFWQYVAQGALLISAVSFDRLRERLGGEGR